MIFLMRGGSPVLICIVVVRAGPVFSGHSNFANPTNYNELKHRECEYKAFSGVFTLLIPRSR